MDNTFGFPAGTTFPSPTNFGTTRIDVLQNELSSGYYTQTADIAALTREIGRVQSGATGDMNVASTLDGEKSMLSSFMDKLKAISSAPAKYIGDSFTQTANDAAKEKASGVIGTIKQFFAESTVAIVTVIVGLLLLYGAFLTFKK